MKILPLNDLPLIEEVASLYHGQKYLVGGCVRDWAMGEKCLDLDFLFDSYPLEAASKLFSRHGGRLDKFEKFRTLRLFLGGRRIDFAAFRKEKYPYCAALPIVSAASSLKQDLRRRDFTVNAMAISLDERHKFELLDPYGGLQDLEKRVLRLLHSRSFRDDPTRLFRAARFCARFSLKPDAAANTALREAARKKFAIELSRERRRNELLKILEEESPFEVFVFLKKWKILDQVYPFFNLRKEIDNFNGVVERMAFMAACFPSPYSFINELNLPGEMKRAVLSEAEPFEKKSAPACISSLQSKIYYVLHKRNLNCAFLSFSDISKAGIESFMAGPILLEAGRLQWSGKIKNRKSALAFLSSKAKILNCRRGEIK
ncbi:MAG: hypothetical protein Fur0012_02710 [Elusimicrobiota bacterium]